MKRLPIFSSPAKLMADMTEEDEKLGLIRFWQGELSNSLKFQVGWVATEVLGAVFFQIMQWQDLVTAAGVWMVPPLCISAGFRIACLVTARYFRSITHQLAMLCLVVSVVCLATCHPEVSRHFAWEGSSQHDQGELVAPPSLDNITRTLKAINSTALSKHVDNLQSTLAGTTTMPPARLLGSRGGGSGPSGGPPAGGPPSGQPAGQPAGQPPADDDDDGPDGPEDGIDVPIPGVSGPSLAHTYEQLLKMAREEIEKDLASVRAVEAARDDLVQENAKHLERQIAWQDYQMRQYMIYVQDDTIVTTSMLILLSYMTTFVIPVRKSVSVIPVCFMIYCFMIAILRDETKELGDFLQQFALEVAIIAFATIVWLVTKVGSEKSQLQLCIFLDKNERAVIQEKVLRCEAEFKHQQLQDDIEEWNPVPIQPGVRDIPESVTESTATGMQVVPKMSELQKILGSKKVKGPASLRSAPPATRGFLEAGLDCGTRSRGDCLPPGASVWVEGQPLPTAVSKLSKGAKVLCFDTVGRCPKYVEVSDMQILIGETDWVNISLSDGTELSVTANHPMQPQSAEYDPSHGLPRIGASVEAKNLKAGVDCLMVLKMVPVIITKVAPCAGSGKGADAERVSLVLRQPERHEVFVAPPNTNQSATVAVGSANAGIAARGAEVPLGPVVKRTFIDMDPLAIRPTRRTSSLPPRLGSEPSEPPADEPPRQEPLAKHASRSRPSAHSGSSRFEGRRRMKRSNSDSEFSSTCKSSESGLPTEVLISANDAQAMSPANLSQLMQVKQMGLPSIGSAWHSSGQCQVCIFHNRHIHDGRAPCWKGALCDHCHVHHEPVGRKKQKSGGMRRFLRKTGGNEGGS